MQGRRLHRVIQHDGRVQFQINRSNEMRLRKKLSEDFVEVDASVGTDEENRFAAMTVKIKAQKSQASRENIRAKRKSLHIKSHLPGLPALNQSTPHNQAQKMDPRESIFNFKKPRPSNRHMTKLVIQENDTQDAFESSGGVKGTGMRGPPTSRVTGGYAIDARQTQNRIKRLHVQRKEREWESFRAARGMLANFHHQAATDGSVTATELKQNSTMELGYHY